MNLFKHITVGRIVTTDPCLMFELEAVEFAVEIHNTRLTKTSNIL